MDRRIKYRGKDSITGDWIYGYFYKSTGGFNKIITENHDHRLILAGSECQYTGLKDKNGTEIYEGDIVRVNIEDFKDGHPESPLLGIDHCNEVVEWNTEGGYWDLTGEGVAPLMAFTESQREVIGNIYENEIETNKG